MVRQKADRKVEQISLLGATGSIGTNVLKIVEQYPERYAIFSLAARQDIKTLLAQCHKFKPKFVVCFEEYAGQQLSRKLADTNSSTKVLFGQKGLIHIASHESVDIVVAAIVGAGGLPSTYAAVEQGKKVLLANKESLVMAGSLIMRSALANNATILPIDSEHNGLLQCLPTTYRIGTRCREACRMTLTASGGAVRDLAITELKNVSPEQAVDHPVWKMGRKISVDSATMMNKVLEVIEAHWLFKQPISEINVLLHPESVMHAMIQYQDGSFIAQLGSPDMRTAIAHCLAYPERIRSGVSMLDLTSLEGLHFDVLNERRYPCFSLGREVIKRGHAAPIIMNAANEIAVEAFLKRRIYFTQIYDVISYALDHTMMDHRITDLEQIMRMDGYARKSANTYVNKISHIEAVV